VHLGSQSVSLIGAALPTWRALPTVIAWRTDGAQARSVGEVLLNAGFEPFALTVGEGGFQLVPLARAREATYAFALSARFADSIGAGA
ncbi:MAG: hypothetical protein MUE41_09220, partial [Gemmatimonadaceae bacterium]|nr:hypothetical protein [Gemmatimonadaceae bacterium]